MGRWDLVAERLYDTFKNHDGNINGTINKDDLDGLFKTIDKASREYVGKMEEETNGVKIQHYYTKIRDGKFLAKRFSEMTNDLKNNETSILSAYLKCPCDYCKMACFFMGILV